MPMSDAPVPLATVAPPPEGVSAAAGTMPAASRADHVHPRLSSVTGPHTLDSNGEATISFTQVFDAQPHADGFYTELADAQPVIFKAKSWVKDGNNKFVGVVLKGYRAQAIPTNLVTQLLGGVFNLFSPTSAAGVSFTCLAVKSSA